MTPSSRIWSTSMTTSALFEFFCCTMRASYIWGRVPENWISTTTPWIAMIVQRVDCSSIVWGER
jgi:hypothetical protein